MAVESTTYRQFEAASVNAGYIPLISCSKAKFAQKNPPKIYPLYEICLTIDTFSRRGEGGGSFKSGWRRVGGRRQALESSHFLEIKFQLSLLSFLSQRVLGDQKTKHNVSELLVGCVSLAGWTGAQLPVLIPYLYNLKLIPLPLFVATLFDLS